MVFRRSRAPEKRSLPSVKKGSARIVGGLLLALFLQACLVPPRPSQYYREQIAAPSVFTPNPEKTTLLAAGTPAVGEQEPSHPGTESPMSARKPEHAGVLDSGTLSQVWNENQWRALLIGISDYSLSGGFAPSLEGVPTNDAKMLRQLLLGEYGFSSVSLLLDREATRQGILSALSSLHSSCSSNDNILVYFAGHGYLPEHGVGVWIPCDAKNQEDGISNSEIKDRLANLPSKRVLLISDSCFSGAFLSRAIGVAGSTKIISDNQAAQQISASLAKNIRPSREVITSGNISPVPNAGKGPFQGNSPFAGALLTALTSAPLGSALSTTDLFVDAYYNLQRVFEGEAERPRPQRGTLMGHAGGEFFFIHKSREAKTRAPK